MTALAAETDRQVVRRLESALQGLARTERAARPSPSKLAAARDAVEIARRELGSRLIEGRFSAWDSLGIEAAPKGRRDNHSGSIYHDRKRDRFVAEVSIDGKRYRVTTRTRPEAEQWIRDAAQRVREGRDVREAKHTVGEWLEYALTEVWPREGLAPKTLQNHRDAVERWWKPTIGDRRLTALRPEDVDAVLGQMIAKGLSPNTCRILTAPLLKALRLAMRRGLVTRNVASLATKPKIRPVREVRFLTPDETRLMLAACPDARFGDAIALSMLLGLRRGELLGITWDRVDLDGPVPTVRIDQQLSDPRVGPVAGTKTGEKGVREIVLSRIEVAVLRRRLERQRFEQRAAADGWNNRWNLVFTTTIGTPVSPRNYAHAVEKLSESVIGRRVSPHALRHGAATGMAEAGVPIKAAQAVLGHTSSMMTAHYTHETREQMLAAAEARQAFFATGTDA